MTKHNSIKLARELRRNQTAAESLLWSNLRGKKRHGVKFYRQHPIIYDKPNNKFFIVDFYSSKVKLVIELDGKIHEFQKESDSKRTVILEGLGLKVIRFENEEVENNITSVLNIIDNVIKHRLFPNNDWDRKVSINRRLTAGENNN